MQVTDARDGTSDLNGMAGVGIGHRKPQGHLNPRGEVSQRHEWVDVERLIGYPEAVVTQLLSLDRNVA